MTLSRHDCDRLDSWIAQIAATLLDTDAIKSEGGGYRVGPKRQLAIYASGHWARYGGKHGETHGTGALSLIALLLDETEDDTDPLVYAEAWLPKHPGDGDFCAGHGLEADRQATLDTLLAAAVPIADCAPVLAYLRSRGLDASPADSEALFALPRERGEESALGAKVTDAKGNVLAVHLVYVTPEGLKGPTAARSTTIGPDAYWQAHGLVRFGPDTAATLILTEGVEDALSLRALQLGTVYACGGASAYGKVAFPRDRRVVLVRDGDAPGSPADRALWRGVARLIGAGPIVEITPRPAELFDDPSLKDANDVLRHRGLEPLRLLFGKATDEPADVDCHVLLDAVAKLDAGAQDRALAPLRRLTGYKTDTIRAELRKRGKRRDAPEPEDGVAWIEAPLAAKPQNLADILSDHRDLIDRYLDVDAVDRDTMVLYAAYLPVSDLFRAAPRLQLASPHAEVGKSTALQLVLYSAPAYAILDDVSIGAFRRLFTLGKSRVVGADEDAGIETPAHMKLLRSGFSRAGASLRLEQSDTKNAAFKTVPQRTLFGPVIVGGRVKIDDANATRTLRVDLEAIDPGEDPANPNSRPPLTAMAERALKDIASRRARWARDNEAAVRDALDDVEQFYERNDPNERSPILIDPLRNREREVFIPLYVVAALAGKAWLKSLKPVLARYREHRARAVVATVDRQVLAHCEAVLKESPNTAHWTAEELLRQIMRGAGGAFEELARNTTYEIPGGKPLSVPQLVCVLRDGFKIERCAASGRGKQWVYTAADFAKAFRRYLTDDLRRATTGGPSPEGKPADTPESPADAAPAAAKTARPKGRRNGAAGPATPSGSPGEPPPRRPYPGREDEDVEIF